MIAVKSMDVRDNFKSFCEIVLKGEVLVVSRPKNENIVMLSEKEYNDIMKAKRNAEYLAKIDESYEQLEQGKTVSFTLKELEDMESDNWKPTKKVIDFMEKMKNE
jgi:antitoxin YefM